MGYNRMRCVSTGSDGGATMTSVRSVKDMRSRAIWVLVLLLLVLGALSGCTKGSTGSSGGASTDGSSEVATLPGEGDISTATAEVYSPEEDADYIRSLGTSHKGEKLYALVIATEKTEAAGRKALLDTLPKLGDIQSYLILEPTDHLKGLKPGQWVVFEAYREKPITEDIEFIDRGPQKATITQVTVTCDDPIPVFEDQMLEGVDVPLEEPSEQ
jgi:hypothetical protein